MNSPYPINWLPGLVLWVVGVLAMPLLGLLVLGLRLSRRVGAKRNAARRASFPRAIARVESHERITQAGDFRLVLELDLRPDAYREVGERARLRGIARLSPAALATVEERREVAVRFDPQSPTTLWIDGDASGDGTNGTSTSGDERPDGGDLEREAYLARGPSIWKRL